MSSETFKDFFIGDAFFLVLLGLLIGSITSVDSINVIIMLLLGSLWFFGNHLED